MLTFQDFQKVTDHNKSGFIRQLISEHVSSMPVKTAFDADRYDRQQNSTIYNFVRTIYRMDGVRVADPTASNNKIASNFFHRLNTQRCTYSLGNGVTFEGDGVKEKLGVKFDTELQHCGYYALIHGVSFMFYNVDHVHVFPLTEFAPLWDEETGALMAGVRYWQIAPDKPVFAVLYEEDGYTRYRAESNEGIFVEQEPKAAYRVTVRKAEADDEPEVVGEENYSSLPIVPFYGNRNKVSTLVGMKPAIDSFDLIRSGFANDLTDCAEIYWIISNADGMDEKDLARFRDRMKLQHVVQSDEGDVHPYTQDIPYNARMAYLNDIRNGIYEDFGGLDVHAVAAGATNDHIDAAYQPLDENADAFEYQIIEGVQKLLELQGVEDTPIFKRNRISNQGQQVDMLLKAANYLDGETILKKLPFVTPDEIVEIQQRKQDEQMAQFNQQQAQAQAMQEISAGVAEKVAGANEDDEDDDGLGL